MAAHVTTVSWVSPTFLDNVPSSSSVLWSQSWSYERATQSRMTGYNIYAIYASWWLHLFFALVKWPGWPSAVMTLNARDNLAKRGGWDVPLNHKRLPNNWLLERAQIFHQFVKACIWLPPKIERTLSTRSSWFSWTGPILISTSWWRRIYLLLISW